MKKIETLLPLALVSAKILCNEQKDAQGKPVKDANGNIVKSNEIDKQFKGYISSFGASVISAGLLPTLVFYSEKGGAEKDRQNLVKAIFDLIQKQGKHQQASDLKDYVLSKQPNRNLAKREIFDACIALKLAIRTFKNV